MTITDLSYYPNDEHCAVTRWIYDIFRATATAKEADPLIVKNFGESRNVMLTIVRKGSTVHIKVTVADGRHYTIDETYKEAKLVETLCHIFNRNHA